MTYFFLYSEFTTVLLDKSDDWTFHLLTMYMNVLSPETKLKIVAAGYRESNIVGLKKIETVRY